MTYDSAGRIITRTDPLQQSITYGYDSRGNRTTITDPLQQVITSVYDGFGQAVQTIDARGKSTNYSYDSRGNVTLVQDALGNETVFQYAGNTDRIASRQDALGRTTLYQYDAWGRNIGTSYPTSGMTGTSFSYDVLGQLVGSTDATGTRTYQYDVWGRPTGMTDPMGTTQATHDAAGRMLTQSDVAGRVHAYTYDSRKRLDSVSDGSQSVQYTYNVDNRVASVQYGNGVSTEYTYDLSGRATSIVHRRLSDGLVLLSFANSYDPNGRLTQFTEQPSGAVTSYSYDALGRLLREKRTVHQPYLDTYTYDSNGNRLTAMRSEGGTVLHQGVYSYNDSSCLVQVTDTAQAVTENYTWHDDGTLASYPGAGYTRRLSYDEEGRLVAVRRDHGSGNVELAYEFGYAADGGRRWRKDHTLAPGDPTAWTWYPCGVGCSAGGLAELQKGLNGGSWTPVGLYLRAPECSGGGGQVGAAGPVAQNGNYYHVDPKGNAVLVTGASGLPVREALYDAFGVERYMPTAGVSLPGVAGDTSEAEGIVRTGSGNDIRLPERALPLVASREKSKPPKETVIICIVKADECREKCYRAYERCSDGCGRKKKENRRACYAKCSEDQGRCISKCPPLEVVCIIVVQRN